MTIDELNAEYAPAGGRLTADFFLQDNGSIVILLPLTTEAKAWVADHIPDDALRFGKGIVIEPRYVDDICNGIVDDGLIIH